MTIVSTARPERRAITPSVDDSVEVLAAAVRASQDLVHLVMDIAFTGMWVTDLLGRTEVANARMAQLTDTDPAQYDPGSVCKPATHAGQAIAAQMHQAAAHGPVQFCVTTATPIGERQRLHIQIAPRTGAAGQVIGSIMSCLDITDTTTDPGNELPSARFNQPLSPSHDLEDGLAGNVQNLLARLHLNMRASLAEALAQVTGTQRQICERVLIGDRVPTIAACFGLSPSTVRNHLSRAYRQLGINSQQELIDLLHGR